MDALKWMSSRPGFSVSVNNRCVYVHGLLGPPHLEGVGVPYQNKVDLGPRTGVHDALLQAADHLDRWTQPYIEESKKWKSKNAKA